MQLLEKNICGSFERSLHQDVQGFRQRLSFTLRDGWLFTQQADGKF
jgi:hypothetical protein